MPAFDYANARLRAMKSRLLSRQTLEELARAGSIHGLIALLADTAYREAIQAAVVRLTGMACIGEALRIDLSNTLGRARTFFSGAEGELATLALGRYDIDNVKTILRGLSAQAPARDIVDGTLPAGELRQADIANLASMTSIRAVVDLLATWRLPLSRPLLDLCTARGGQKGDPGLLEMELALDRWYYATALKGAGNTTLHETLMLSADAANILSALRLVGVSGGASDAAAILHDQLGDDDPALLFVGPGRLPFNLLAEVTRQESVINAVEVLAQTSYGPALAGALDAYRAAGRLSVFERALARQQLQGAAGLFARDPLGIGVLVGYAALKTNEIANIRVVAQGVMLADRPDRILAELMPGI